MNTLVGNFPIFEGTSLWSGRLDQQISSNNQLSLRVGVSPSTVTGIQVNAQGPQNFGQNAWSRTSDQTYRDFSISANDTWTLGNNKVNEFRFQYARRGLLYNYASEAPGGSNVAINIPGYAFFGREPFSFVRRTEQRYEALDNFTWTAGHHTVKFGFDANFLPLARRLLGELRRPLRLRIGFHGTNVVGWNARSAAEPGAGVWRRHSAGHGAGRGLCA